MIELINEESTAGDIGTAIKLDVITEETTIIEIIAVGPQGPAGGVGGGGTPGGLTTQVQFNDAGAFGGDAGLTYNKTTDSLTIGGDLTLAGIVTGSQLRINSSNSPFSIGNLSSVAGAGDLAIGFNARATGQSVVIGYNAGATTLPNGSTVVGFNANALANGVAFGSSSNAAANSFALGSSANASGTGSVAMGYSAVSDTNATFVAGGSLVPLDNVYFGKGRVNATPTLWTLNGTGGNGTNVAGADIAIAGGAGTGTGVGGSILLKTAPAGSTGVALNIPATRLSIDQTGTVAISGLTTNGFVKTNGGTGTLSVDTNTYAQTNSVTLICDGSGSVLSTGTKNPIKIPYGGTLTGWLLIGTPSGSVTVDILRAANGAGLPVTSIVGAGTKPALSSAVENSSTSFTSWTSTTLTAKDNLAISLSGVTTTYVALTLYFS